MSALTLWISELDVLPQMDSAIVSLKQRSVIETRGQALNPYGRYSPHVDNLCAK